MNSTQQGSSEICRGRVNKTDKTRRGWTGKEEETLLLSLKELVAHGWKSDNGFRAGYLHKLEDAMRVVFPGTDLKGVPHINSKICAWKKSYNSLVEMLKPSGVGFNANGDHTIDCTDEQWELIIKKDPNARLMRFKSWPLLDDWKIVFGKDRATGEHAEDLMDAVADMYRRENISTHTSQAEYHVNLDDIHEAEGVDESASQTKKKDDDKAREGAVPSKKRKALHVESGRGYEVLREISRETNLRLENFAARIGYDVDMGQAKKDVFDLVSTIDGLELEERFDVCELLAYKVERLEIFLGLPVEARAAYARRLLEGRSK